MSSGCVRIWSFGDCCSALDMSREPPQDTDSGKATAVEEEADIEKADGGEVAAGEQQKVGEARGGTLRCDAVLNTAHGGGGEEPLAAASAASACLSLWVFNEASSGGDEPGGAADTLAACLSNGTVQASSRAGRVPAGAQPAAPERAAPFSLASRHFRCTFMRPRSCAGQLLFARQCFPRAAAHHASAAVLAGALGHGGDAF